MKRQYLPHHPADYIRAIQGREWFRAAFPSQLALMDVTCGRSKTRSYTDTKAHPPKIVIGECHRRSIDICEWSCLHELSHAVTKRSDPGHGPAWRRNYIVLVRFMLGYRAARYLRDVFKQDGLSA
jgi:putative metallohydrolase (TIGR04338 family)